MSNPETSTSDDGLEVDKGSAVQPRPEIELSQQLRSRLTIYGVQAENSVSLDETEAHLEATAQAIESLIAQEADKAYQKGLYDSLTGKALVTVTDKTHTTPTPRPVILIDFRSNEVWTSRGGTTILNFVSDIQEVTMPQTDAQAYQAGVKKGLEEADKLANKRVMSELMGVHQHMRQWDSDNVHEQTSDFILARCKKLDKGDSHAAE